MVVSFLVGETVFLGNFELAFLVSVLDVDLLESVLSLFVVGLCFEQLAFIFLCFGLEALVVGLES